MTTTYKSVFATALAFTLSALPTLSSAQEDTEDCNIWTGSVDLGGSYLSGNTNLKHVYGAAEVQRCLEDSHWILGAEGAYGESAGELDKSWMHAYSQYTYNFSYPFYGGLFTDYWTDDIADLKYRVSLNPLLGFYVYKNNGNFLALEGGPAYVWQDQGGVTDDYLALRFAQRFQHFLNPGTKIWQSVEYTPEIEDFGNYQLVAEAGIQTWLAPRVSVKAYLQDRYVSQPVPGVEDNDLGMFIALSYGSAHPDCACPEEGGSGNPLERWVTTGTVGGSKLSGNTDATALSAALDSRKRFDANELGAGIFGGYGKVGDNVTAEQYGGYVFYNYDIAPPKWYAGVRTDYLHDTISDLEYRVATGFNVGYRAIETPTTTLKLEAGPSYVFEKQGGLENNHLGIRAGEYFDHFLSKKVRVFQSFEYLGSFEDQDDYFMINKGGFDISLTPCWTLSNSIVHTYDNTPALGRKESDLAITSGLKWTF